MSTFLTPYLKQAFSGLEFSTDQAVHIFNYILNGLAEDVEISALLGAMAAREETENEILGAIMAMRDKGHTISAPENVIDCCGTGGDGVGSYNISTAVSLVIAGCGVPVAKHGNRAATSKSGAADILEASGVRLDAPAKIGEQSLIRDNICFLMAPQYNPAARHVAKVRQTLKARTIFNLLGPLLNPARPQRQLIGVYDNKWAEPMARVLNNLGSRHVWIVHGHDGMDEITVTGPSYITSLKDGVISSFVITPEEYNIPRHSAESLKGGDAYENKKALEDLLNGKNSAYRDIVLLNAAAGLIVAGHSASMTDGLSAARDSIDNGRAQKSLQALINNSHL